MNLLKKDLLILISLLCAAATGWLATQGQRVDIQLHDTYYILDNTFITLTVLGLLLLVIFIIRAARLKFKSWSANSGLALGLMLVTWIALTLIRD
jgi:hypothetical protein